MVIFDEPLRQEVEHYAALMHQILQSQKTPQSVYGKKCESCSMKPVCLPMIVESAIASSYLTRAIDANLRQSSSGQATQDEDKPQ
jgi:CRISPR-associated exonuclease Cas4